MPTDLASDYTNKVYLIEANNTNTGYYRLYSDGWCEQWGIYQRSSTGTFYLTLPKEMKDTNYTALMTCGVKNRDGDFTSNWTFAPYSTTQVQIYSKGTVYSDYPWYVCGYTNYINVSKIFPYYIIKYNI